MSYGPILKAAREALDLSQEQVAEKIGVSRTTVAAWELGQTHPTRKYWETIDEHLGVRLLLTAESALPAGPFAGMDHATYDLLVQVSPSLAANAPNTKARKIVIDALDLLADSERPVYTTEASSAAVIVQQQEKKQDG